MKKVLLTILILIFLASPLQAATTLTHTTGSSIYQLNTLDADFTFDGTATSAYVEYMWISSIEFVPGAANDILVLKEAADTGEHITILTSTDGESRVKYFDSTKVKIMFDFSASTITSGAIVIITRSY